MDGLVRVVEDAAPARAYWDLRVERARGLEVEARAGDDVEGTATARRGVAVRVLHRGAWGFGSTASAEPAQVRIAAQAAVRAARALARASAPGVRLAPPERPATGRFALPAGHDPEAADPADLAAFVLDCHARLPEGRARTCGIAAAVVEKEIATSDGARVALRLPRARLDMDVTRDGTSLGRRLGGSGGLEHLSWAEVERARDDLDEALALHRHVRPLPRAALPVLVDPELAGVFAHEAVGHACEADLVLSGESVFKDLVGARVGTEEVTVLDDPTLAGGFGTSPVDDEGLPARRKTLIERGVLREFIQSRETAGRMGVPANGGARAEDHAAAPMPRMSNTLFAAGTWAPDDLRSHARRCVWAKGTRGGQVDTTRGAFQFTPQECYLVERGEVVGALRGAGLSGGIRRVLRSIVGVGRDARLAGIGMCGKGQWVPVGDGGPTLLLAEVTLGGA